MPARVAVVRTGARELRRLLETELGSGDTEPNRNPPAVASWLEDDETRVRGFGRCGRGGCGTDAWAWSRGHRRHGNRDAVGRLLERRAHGPVACAAAGIGERDLADRRGARLDEAEREARRRREDERPVRADEVDRPAAFAGRVRLGPAWAEDRLAGQHERRLDLLDRPAAMALAEQCRGARNMRRRHARPAEARP